MLLINDLDSRIIAVDEPIGGANNAVDQVLGTVLDRQDINPLPTN
jgi:hypothetical protein